MDGVPHGGDVILDFDSDGTLIAIEVLPATLLPAEVLAQAMHPRETD